MPTIRKPQQPRKYPNVVDILDYTSYVLNLGTANEDWQPAIQKAIADAAQKVVLGSYESNVQGKVTFPIRKFKIRKPIVLPSQGFVLEGTSSSALLLDNAFEGFTDLVPCTVIEKTTNTTNGPKTRPSRGNTRTDNFDVDAFILVDHPDNVTNYNTQISNLTLIGSSSANIGYGVFAPRATHIKLENIQFYNTDYCYQTYDTWQSEFVNVKARNCITIMRWSDDGSGGGTGTSNTFTNVWANTAQVAYDITLMSYSSFNNCAADHILTGAAIAYKFDKCDGIVLNGCGTEDVKGDAIYLSGNTVLVANAFKSYQMQGVTTGSRGIINVLYGCYGVFNGCRFWDYAAGVDVTKNFNFYIAANSYLKFSMCKFPSNAGMTQFIGTGGTAIIEDAAGITIKTNSGSRAL